MHRGEPEALCRRDVVEEALGDVQNGVDGHAEALERQLEVARIGLVAAGLLGRYDFVELDSQAARREGEQVVIHVGDHRQPIARREDAQGGHGVVEGSPAGDRLRERGSLLGAGREPQLAPELVHHPREDIPVRAVGARLDGRFEAGEMLQDLRGRKCVAVRGQHALDGPQNPALPVDERAVAVEGDNLEGGEVHRVHQLISFSARAAAASAPPPLPPAARPTRRWCLPAPS